MAGGNVSPRQKMINMMYLVLTALLALNVSKEILKAFHLVEMSFEKTGKSIDSKNNALMTGLRKQEEEKPGEVRPFREKADKVMAIHKEFNEYIAKMKEELITTTGGRKPAEGGEETGELVGADNIEVHANYFMLQGKGAELQKKINDANAAMLAVLEPDSRKLINKNFVANDNPNKAPQTWYSENFEHSPLAGVVAILTKIQNDCKTTQAEVLEQLTKDINANKLVFDQVIPIVVPESPAVMVGQKFKAGIILGAYNSKVDNDVTVNGAKLKSAAGVATFENTPSREGEFTFKGTINVIGPKGPEAKPFDIKFQAFQAAATISATAMNVFYAGLDNPVSVSVPGANPANVNVSIDGPGSLSKKGGTDYVYRIGSLGAQRKVSVRVSVKMPDGSTRTFPGKEYRLKNVPTPEARLGGLVSGRYTATQIRVQPQILAYMEGFVFEGVTFTVVSYELVYIPKRGEFRTEKGNSAAISPTVRGLLNNIRPGDKVIIQGIKARGPGGMMKSLTPIVLDVS